MGDPMNDTVQGPEVNCGTFLDSPDMSQATHPSDRPEYHLDTIFKYHPSTHLDDQKYKAIREAARHFAQVIVDNAPNCEDRKVALGEVRWATMIANAAIALDPR